MTDKRMRLTLADMRKLVGGEDRTPAPDSAGLNGGAIEGTVQSLQPSQETPPSHNSGGGDLTVSYWHPTTGASDTFVIPADICGCAEKLQRWMQENGVSEFHGLKNITS